MTKEELLAKANLVYKLGVDIYNNDCDECQFHNWNREIGCNIWRNQKHQVMLNEITNQLEYVNRSVSGFDTKSTCIGFLYPKNYDPNE
jgi:hypothetical protein